MLTNMRILVGYDGSPYAEAAIYDLRRAGLPADADVAVMTCAEVSPHLPPSCYEPLDPPAVAELPPILRNARSLAQAALADAKSVAARGAALVKQEFPRWEVEPITATDSSPYRTLVVKADAWRPDLVVVGSHGRSAAGRALLGSVSQNVLSHAICSVRVARHREDAGRLVGDPVRLVLGIDGSPDSAAAVSAIADRPWPDGSEVLVVVAIDPVTSMALAWGPAFSVFGARPVVPGDDNAHARAITESVAKELRRSGLTAVPIVQNGDPKMVLLREADRFNADCIFVGANGHSRLERFMLGSVSAAVAARAHCSVEVVRQG